ncbi:P-loop ATPase, MinD superfamily [Desulfocapsa sulfexigens DSM 10523]|uniref:p-loop ATPase, MinD superfamily n=1 Tax=Desulfocapsa sulfexigens (strain DSM 10523 / SB164P1) TaxID=1167006 RepID=M1P5L4_DESSD|nr:ATP-binding protein [Desulfocapsa sulfexigens]AGF76962.1 P-loop ATPase, MinD superfamily [Desulfocapsa sulfexigens DSM 10523]
MQIAVGSGKGGTGKTTISTSLALSAGTDVQYLDCDVEEPNGHIFLKPKLTHRETVVVTVPRLDESRCTACGKCRDICAFNAIAQFGKTVMIFPEMCHSCLGCFRVCEEDALIEDTREIGILESGMAGDIHFVHGRVRIGEAMGVPLLKAVKHKAEQDRLTIIDAPPGTSCPFVESVNDADYVILVTEPTPFGLHDLKLAATVLKNFKIPSGVIINRSDLGDDRVQRYCDSENIPVLLEIPFQRAIAEGYARGINLVDTVPELRTVFSDLLTRIAFEVAQ